MSERRPSVGQAAPTPTVTTVSVDGGTAGPPPPPIVVVLPLHLAPVGNRREHPLTRARRTRREINAVLKGLVGHKPPPLPVVFDLCRTGWNALDPDGLVASMKAPIDALAEWLGVNDRNRRLYWRLSQAVTREKRVSRRTGRWEAAASLRIVVRRWLACDGDHRLCVLAAPPPCGTAVVT